MFVSLRPLYCSTRLLPQLKAGFLVKEECCSHVLVILYRHVFVMKIKPVESLQHHTHIKSLRLKALFKHVSTSSTVLPPLSSPPHPPPPSTSSSSRGVYSRTQRFLGLLSGGSRAARMASSNTFFSPLWERDTKRETLMTFPSQEICSLIKLKMLEMIRKHETLHSIFYTLKTRVFLFLLSNHTSMRWFVKFFHQYRDRRSRSVVLYRRQRR